MDSLRTSFNTAIAGLMSLRNDLRGAMRENKSARRRGGGRADDVTVDVTLRLISRRNCGRSRTPIQHPPAVGRNTTPRKLPKNRDAGGAGERQGARPQVPADISEDDARLAMESDGVPGR
jgi:hypothetical protein